VLGHGLPRHVQMFAKLAKGLPVVLVQPVQQQPAAGVGESLEHFVRIGGHVLLCNHRVACQERLANRRHEETWIERRLRWLAGTLGIGRLLDAEVLLPTDDSFPHEFQGNA
jgi:hypothetical protein